MAFTSTFHAFQDGMIFTVALGLLLVFLLQHSDLPVRLRWVETDAPFKEASCWQKQREVNSYWTIALAAFEKAVHDLKEATKSDKDEEVDKVELNLSRLSHLDENPSVYRNLKDRTEIQVKKLAGEIRRDFREGSQLAGDETGELNDGDNANVESALHNSDEENKTNITEAEANQNDPTTQTPRHHDPAAQDLSLATIRLSTLRDRYATDLTSIQTSLNQATLHHKLKMTQYNITPGLLAHERESESDDLTFDLPDLIHEDLDVVSRNLSAMIEEKRKDAAKSIARMHAVERRSAEILARLDGLKRGEAEVLDPVREPRPRPCDGEERGAARRDWQKKKKKSVVDFFFGGLCGTRKGAVVRVPCKAALGEGERVFGIDEAVVAGVVGERGEDLVAPVVDERVELDVGRQESSAVQSRQPGNVLREQEGVFRVEDEVGTRSDSDFEMVDFENDGELCLV